MAKWEGGGEEAARRRRMENKKLRTGIRAGAAVSFKAGEADEMASVSADR